MPQSFGTVSKLKQKSHTFTFSLEELDVIVDALTEHIAYLRKAEHGATYRMDIRHRRRVALELLDQLDQML